MAKKEQNFLDWLLSHGIMLAYGAAISFVLAVCAVVLLTVVLFVSWWNKIH